MTVDNKLTEITIEQVQEQFRLWRAIKNKPRAIPERLWVLARKLVGRYKVSKIIQGLNLNSAQYKCYILQQPISKIPKKEKQRFVQAVANASFALAAPSLTINKSNDTSIVIQNASIEQMACLINALRGTA